MVTLVVHHFCLGTIVNGLCLVYVFAYLVLINFLAHDHIIQILLVLAKPVLPDVGSPEEIILEQNVP